ncbi:undecaprenyl-diphosphate phosphatase [Desulfovibrio mangrovi]|uniref:undecaprenyl-diphosphate phosphatase n=1 Tax=Desulfovibrio mangrovi TaxID=2976983 RepID=UPI002247EB06|nr:undecaprenyl-diphosphate phosphatase [Desulfovibrio mangrovi]UZP68396.1 undecaprenyl-diphosphate phosphatase [Desulfovibrio mangrovi]
MHDILSAVWLGIVEGLTEFLPVSSTGHLIITGNLLNVTGPKADTFEVVIQLGAILAVVVLYWERFLALIKPRQDMRFSGMRGLWLLFLTSLPASIAGLLFHGAIKEHLFTPVTVGLALGVGALYILYVEGRTSRNGERGTYSTLDDITPALALGIGLFQCLALWPGFSRSAATIMGAMLLGARRSLAAEYSFIAAVPIMFAATGYDLLKNYALFTADDMLFLSVGFAVSFVAAWAAVKTFITLVGRITFRPFAWYRLALAPVVLYFWY